KSLDRNSYNSGDHFNRIDWTGTTTVFGSGLPPAPDNEPRWPLMAPLLRDPTLKPRPEHIREARTRALELLRIRASSPLVGEAEVTFEQGAPGVIVMVLSHEIVVIFNAPPKSTRQPAHTGAPRLHPALKERRGRHRAGVYSVPAR